MGYPESLGKVQPGYYADVILVDGDPLEDIEIFQDTSKLHAIILNGHVHKNIAVAGKDGQSITAEGVPNERTIYTNLPLASSLKQEEIKQKAEVDGVGVDPRAM